MIMQNNIEQIYSEIKEKLTSDHLKKITINIINFYKKRSYSHLRKYVSILGIDRGIKSEKLFSLLIRHYHPDKLSFILKQADDLYISGDYPELLKFHDSYFFTLDEIRDLTEIDIELRSEYSFDDHDLSNREREVFENESFAESTLEFDDEPYCFLDAVKKFFYGGYDYDITEYDLENMDGALDLSDTEIEELDGIEHCINLDELNLSNNKIERISKLTTLENLQSLFLSGNNIESISPLGHPAKPAWRHNWPVIFREK